jgi:ring-1,2-phenylacetyl-CoA epoxidase subunit PaaC
MSADTMVVRLEPGTKHAVELLLLAMADDDFVIGFSDSEWTGIAPLLEEDVAISSLAQDELGHAQAYYRLLAELVDDGRDADAIAYDRPPEGYYHARLLDHARGDWADTIVRRFLYDTADTVRLDALAAGTWAPLAELVAKIRREERYHVMHATAWFERLAETEGEPRSRLLAALERMAPDAATVLAPLPREDQLVEDGILSDPFAALEDRWRTSLAPIFERLRLPALPVLQDAMRARSDHSGAFRWLHGEFISVRRLDPGATW